MKNVKPNSLYVSVDGDSIGAKVGRAVLANDVDELHAVSARIDAAQDHILNWCKDVGGVKISGGGDEATMSVPKEAKEKLKELRKEIEEKFGYTISVGVGRSLSEAGTALLVAKLRGKDCIVYFNKHIKEDIKKAKRRVKEKRASQEEYKLSEAYLEKSEGMICNLHKKELHKNHIHKLHKHEEGAHDSGALSNPDNEDNRSDDCNYCADLDAEENADGTAGMHDCDMCKEYDANQQNAGGIDTDDCPYCKEQGSVENSDSCPMCQEYDASKGSSGLENITGSQNDPQGEGHICNCPNCPEKDQTNLAVEDMEAQKPDDCPQCQEMYSQAIENGPGQNGQEDPKLQGHETAEEVLDLLDQEPGQGEQAPSQEAKKIDNTELPQGDQMEEGTSVPENFGEAQKNDISDEEKSFGEDNSNEPDMAGVLQSGLEDHANEQKKQQVLDMVSQTLQGFKANKESLEAAKDQNQALYNSCIQMLRSMIELCKLLGLQPKMPQSGQDMSQSGQDMSQSKQVPPQAAPQEGAAQAPKPQAG